MTTTPEQRFAAIVERHLRGRGVTSGTGFGGNQGLRFNKKIFAMLVRGELVVKLPRDRVDELTSSGVGRHFDAGKGRQMKGWLSVPTGRSRRWSALVDEAREFARPSARRS